MFNKEPIRQVNNVLDFIGDKKDGYLSNYEEISMDYGGFVSIETSIFANICELLFKREQYEKVLDVGCGAGYVLSRLESSIRVGLDISLNELVHVLPGSIVVRSFAEDTPFENGYFDAVLCLDVLEHVISGYKLVQELTRVLKVGGSLFLACPWEQDLSVYELEEYKQNYKQYKYKHQRSINAELIDVLFKNYRMVNSTMVTAHARFMKFTPYPIRFMHFKLMTVE